MFLFKLCNGKKQSEVISGEHSTKQMSANFRNYILSIVSEFTKMPHKTVQPAAVFITVFTDFKMTVYT